MFLDLPQYIEQQKTLACRTRNFTCPKSKQVVVQSSGLYAPILINKEYIIPHPRLRTAVVRFFLNPSKEDDTAILQVFIGLVA